MHTRPYTAVLVNSETRSSRVEQVSANVAHSKAKDEIESQFTGYKLIALIPGHHAAGMSSFDLAAPAQTGRYLDLFDNSLGS